MSFMRKYSVRFALLGLVAALVAMAAPSAFARSSWGVSIGGPGYGVGYTSGWGGHGYGYVGGGYGYGYGGGYYPTYGYSTYYSAYPAYYGGYYGGYYPAYAPVYPSVVYYDRPVRPYYRGHRHNSRYYNNGYDYGNRSSYYDRGYRD